MVNKSEDVFPNVTRGLLCMARAEAFAHKDDFEEAEKSLSEILNWSHAPFSSSGPRMLTRGTCDIRAVSRPLNCLPSSSMRSRSRVKTLQACVAKSCSALSMSI